MEGAPPLVRVVTSTSMMQCDRDESAFMFVDAVVRFCHRGCRGCKG